MHCQEEDMCGYDEVGIGDFFGPTVYVSVNLTKQNIKALARSGVNLKDSKKCSNQEILNICQKLKNQVDYHYQIVYDNIIPITLNSVSSKVYYHFKNYQPQAKYHVIDLFTTTNSFYKYSKELNINWSNNIILETKADSKYLCVALASILARGIFLTEIYNLQKQYPLVTLKLGANVLDVGKKFCEVYGIDELSKIVKTSFKTYKTLYEVYHE